MGVRGLSSYVSDKGDIYFKKYQLQSQIVIIDGFCLASNLYNCSTNMNPAFGGDYDKYSHNIVLFFNTLSKCNVKPVVICDGGYERKKIRTVIERTSDKIYSLQRVTPLSPKLNCFPLMLRHVFKETLLSLKVTVLQSDFEADQDIAALANKLDVPVITNDSDFIIFDVSYIPISSISFDSCEVKGGQCYIPCKIFHKDNSLDGLPKSMLPLLATLLGNDYIKPSVFRGFYNRLKMDKHLSKPSQKRVKAVLKWLKEENLESAVYKVFYCIFPKYIVHNNICIITLICTHICYRFKSVLCILRVHVWRTECR